MNKRGDQIKNRVAFSCVLVAGIVFHGEAQVPPPIPEPSADAIARAIEAERKRREAELNNPITQIAIQRAQQIQIALNSVFQKIYNTIGLYLVFECKWQKTCQNCHIFRISSYNKNLKLDFL